MRYTYLIYAVGAALSVATLGSCSRADEIPFAGGEGQHSDATVEIALSIPSLATRTSVGEDDGRTLTPKWDVGDSFGLLIRSADGSELNERFDAACEFTHIENAHDLNNELFTGLVPRMASGTYDYYAIYPMPSEGSISGTTVRCTVPSIQTGEYDGGSDLMWAHAVGEELDQNLYNNLDLRFKHLTHALKITVPEELNRFGTEIERIAIEFPQPVAGDMLVDYTDGRLDMSTLTTSKIEIRFGADNPFESDKSFWVYTAPVILTGAVRFTAYNDKESLMSDYIETSALGVLEPQHITPVRLAVTAGFKVTWFDYSVDWSQLGEPVETLTLKLPDGYEFADGGSEKVLAEFDGRYSFALRNDDLAGGLNGQTIETTYESEHAIIRDERTPLRVADFTPSIHNYKTVLCPYLFFEDFSSVASFSSYDEHATSNAGSRAGVSFLDGWSGGRIGALAGTSIRIACHRETSARYPARVDSAPIRNLKEGAIVNVIIVYDYGVNRQNGGIGSANVGQTVYMGYITTPDVYRSGDDDGTYVADFNINEQTGTWTNLPYVGTFNISECFNQTRLSWRTNIDYNAGLNNSTCWLYIDNIRVSIAQ